MEGVVLDQFNKMKPSTITVEQLNLHLYYESYQDDSTTVTYLCIILKFILQKKRISPLLTTMLDHRWLHKAVSLCIIYLYTIMYLFITFYYF